MPTIAGALAAALWILAPLPARAANTTYTLTPSTNVWSTDTWSSTISAIAAGDLAQFNTAGTATTSLDTNVVLGELQTGTTAASIWSITGTTNTFTLDGTGITAANQAFGNAGVAAIASRNAGGNLTLAPAVSFGTTALDIGTTNTGTVTITGGITATAIQNLNFRANGTGGITVSTTAIGASGSTINISNLGTSSGSVTLSATLGVSVGSVLQNSSTSSLTLSGTNTNYDGATTLQGGTLLLGSATALGGNGSTTGTGGSFLINGGTLNSNVSNLVLTTKNAIALNANFSFTNNNLTFDAGSAVTLGSNVGIGFTTGNSLTFGGSVGGSFALTKYSLFNNTGNLVLNGASNSYTGGTNVFNGTLTMASVPSTGSIFIRDAVANSQGTSASVLALSFNPTQAVANTVMSNIASNSTGVLALATGISSNLSFASLGNLSLGATVASTYSGTLTPFNQTYQLGGGGNTLTVSSVLADVNSTQTNLIVDPVASGSSPGSVTLTGANTYTGKTAVNTGTLKLDFSGASAPTTNIISSGSALVLGNSATLNVTGKSAAANSQAFGSTTLQSGENFITATQNSATSLSVSLGAITRSNGSGLFVTFPTTGSMTTTSAADPSGQLLGAYATTGSGTSVTFVSNNAGTLGALAYAVSPTSLQGTTITDTTGLVSTTTNYSLSAAVTSVTSIALANTLRTSAAMTLTLGSGGSLTTNGILTSNGALTIADSSSNGLFIGPTKELFVNTGNGNVTISAPIKDNASGASSVAVAGGGTTFLTGANIYTGGTTLNQGTLALGNNSALGIGTLTMNGGFLTNTGSGSFTFANNFVVTTGTSSTIWASAATGGITQTGTLTGGGTLFVGINSTQNTSVNLNGDNSGFTGTLVYNSNGSNGNTLTIGGGTAASNNLSQATLSGISNGTRRFSVSAGTLQIGALTGMFQFIGGNTYQFGALNTDTTWGGTVAGGSNPVWVKVGTGTFTLNGAGAINLGAGGMGNGGLTINGGTYVNDLSNITNGVNQLTSAPLTLQGGTLKVLEKAGTASSQAINGTTINAGSSSIVVNQNGGSAGVVVTLAAITRATSNGGTVDFVLPTGTQSSTNGITTTTTTQFGNVLVQSGTNSTAFATVNGGSDWASITGVSGSNITALASYSADTFTGSQNSDVTANDAPGAGNVGSLTLRFNTDNRTLTLDGANTVILGGILVTPNAAATGVTIGGAGTLTTGGGNEFIFADYGKLTVSAQLINNGTTALTKSGTGLLILSNTNNTYSGVNYLNDGIVQIAADGSLGANTGVAAVSFNGGTLQLGVSYGSTLFSNNRGINLGFKGGTLDTNGNSVTYGGVIASSAAIMGTTSENTAGQFGFTKTGSGTLTLSNASQTYAGATTITGGTLSVTSFGGTVGTAGNVAGGLGRSSNYAKNLVLNGGTLQYNNGGAGETTDRLFTLGDNGGAIDASGAGALVMSNAGAVGYQINSSGASTNSSPTLTLTGTNTNTNTLAASIGNNGVGSTSLTKSGTGVWALTSSNTYSGATVVSNGTLLANNTGGSATGSGAVTIAASGKLGGSGQAGLVTSNAAFTNNGTLFAGQAGATDAQVLTVATSGNINLGGTVSLDIIGGANSGSLNGQSGNNDKIIFSKSSAGGDATPVISGALQINTSLSTSNAGLWAAGSSWDLFDWASNLGTSFSNLPTGGSMMGNVAGLPDLSALGYQWNWTNLYTTGVISVSVVPEPDRVLLLLLGVGVFIMRRRRRD